MKRFVTTAACLFLGTLLAFPVLAQTALPGFSKAFDPDIIGPASISMLTFEINNSDAPGTPATNLSFTDVLPAGVAIASVPDASTTCTGGTLTANAGATTISYTGGTVGGGLTCTIVVNVTAGPGDESLTIYTNTSGDLTSSAGNSGPATDELMVDTTLPGFSKQFSPATLAPGNISMLIFIITNESISPNSFDFSDDLPAGVVVADPAGATTTCTAGTVNATSGSGTVALTGGQVDSESSCTVMVNVTSSTPDTYVNTASLISGGLNVGKAVASLLVDAQLPAFSKSFSPNPVQVNMPSTLTFTIDNTASASAATSLAFTDNLPDGVQIASPTGAATTCGGTVSAGPAGTSVSFSGGSVAAGAMCTVSVNVKSLSVGTYTNLAESLTSSAGTSGKTPADLTVSFDGPLPTFTKVFGPATIGPGSASTLTFTINNTASVPADNLNFTDTLPAGQTIAFPSSASTDCGAGALSAPDGGTTISLSGGTVGSGGSCIVEVNVTGTMTSLNVSGDLTSGLGNSGSASATLTVDTNRPGFSKSFSPSSIGPGGTSTLTFTIDNTANPALETSLSFSDNLPGGLVIAPVPNTFTNCGEEPSVRNLQADPGTGLFTFSYFGSAFVPAITAGATCTVSVDVTASEAGVYENVSTDLNLSDDRVGGFATARLGAPREFLNKLFTDDPVPPGGTVTLEFTLQNPSRSFAATGITFDDDLGAVISGLAPSGPLPATPCGAGSSLSFAAGVLTLTGGNLAPEGSCTYSVALLVPAGAAAGSYTNTTTAVMATIDGAGVTGNMATDVLRVSTAPILTKEFIDDPTGAGGAVTLRFTIINTDPTSGLTDIAFTDDIGGTDSPRMGALPGLAANSLVSGQEDDPMTDVCGPGSEITVEDPPDINIGGTIIVTPADPTMLVFSGGSLDAAGLPGSTCTFDVVLDVPAGTPGGSYTNTTSEITAMNGAGEITGNPAIDEIAIIAAPTLRKEFTDDPVQPGETVTLEFTLTNNDPDNDATDIAFTDDLTSTTLGLAAAAGQLPLTDVCAPGNGTLTGSARDTSLTFSGGTLAPGEECTFSVTLDVPAGAPGGTFTNTTSAVTATVAGMMTTGNAASDDLVISTLVFTKEFTDDPVIPGGTVTLKFTIDNQSTTDDATDISFDDPLNPDVMPGLTAPGPFPTSPCGAGSTLSTVDPPGTTTEALRLTGGNLLAGEMCMFEVTLEVPASAVDGGYPNVTSDLFATIGGTFSILPPASDVLEVNGTGLDIEKEFTDDPVAPGDPVTLRFTLTNLDSDDTASSIAFTDDLGATLAGLAATGLPFVACGGTVAAIPDAGTIDFSGGSLGAGASCFFDITVSVPAGAANGTYPNTTSEVTGTIGGLGVTGDPATDDLVVFDAETTLTATLDDSLNDTNGQGTGNEGETIDYTAVLTNTGSEIATNVTFSLVPDPLTPLLPGTVVAPAGAEILQGNGGGDTEIEVGIRELAGGASVQITFTLGIGPVPPAQTVVTNQGQVSSDNAAPLLTQDPDDSGPTDTPVSINQLLLDLTVVLEGAYVSAEAVAGAMQLSAADLAAALASFDRTTSATADSTSTASAARVAGAALMRRDLSAVLPTTDPYLGTKTVPAGFFTSDPVGQRVVDWLLVVLASGDPGTGSLTLEAQQPALLLDDGSVVNAEGLAPLPFDLDGGDYFIGVGHRNHLAIHSATAHTLARDVVVALDFSTSQAQAFNDPSDSDPTPQKDLGGGLFGLVAGDGRKDVNDAVTTGDFFEWLLDFGAAPGVYLPGDYNLDGNISTADFFLWRVNLGELGQSLPIIP